MRIIAGRWRGTKLVEIGTTDPRIHLRPSADRFREAVFSMLNAPRYENAVMERRVLDLFAGTGALGLEAVSRGAQFAHFVENNSDSQTLLRKNIEIVGAANMTKVARDDATRLPQNTGAPFELVFMDPPYNQSLGERAIDSANANGYLAD